MSWKKEYNQKKIQTKVVNRWKEKYRLNGIQIIFDRYGKASWEMKSSLERFASYHAAVMIDDITAFDENVAKFKREYPDLLKVEIEKIANAYPDNPRFREDQRMFMKVFGRK